MPLTDAQIRSLGPRSKRFAESDGNGLLLEVMPSGAKYWRHIYRIAGKQRQATLGTYPEIKLSDARKAVIAAKAVLHEGRDPHPPRTARTSGTSAASLSPLRSFDELLGPEPGATFREIADEYVQKRRTEGVAKPTLDKMGQHLAKMNPSIGSRAVADLEAADLLPVLRCEEAKGQYETARRMRSLMGRIFRFAVATSRARRDVAADLRDALIVPQVTHRPGLTEPSAIGELMRSIRGYGGTAVTQGALLIQAYCFLRPGETRFTEWAEIDLERARWRIPGERMKIKGRDHIVPLSSQALEVFQWIKPLTGDSQYVFPSLRNPKRVLSENSMNVALIGMGVPRDRHVPHGFRTTASTSLNEAGWNADWVEAQLAHAPRDQVRGAYNAAKWLKPRAKMMQAYADWLDRLAAGEDLTPEDMAPETVGVVADTA